MNKNQSSKVAQKTFFIFIILTLFITIQTAFGQNILFTGNFTTFDLIAQGEPFLYFDNEYTQLVPQFHKLVEDIPQTFYIRSSNTENYTLEYFIGNTNICTLINPTTGQINCLVTHQILTGTNQPAVEIARNQSIRIFSDNLQGIITYPSEDYVFQLIPVNNQAQFLTIPTDITILSNEIFTLDIEGIDQELDYPLNFTLISTTPIGLEINQTSNTTAQLYFTTLGGFAGNSQQGNHTITVNLTDNAGFNSTRPAKQFTFTLEILPTNFPPQFTTNFSEIPSGTQYEQYTIFIKALDTDLDDVLDITVSEPQFPLPDYICPNFPWINDLVMLNTSATNATAMINTTLTIDHVICRYVDFILNDGETPEIRIPNVFLEIINVNDPPTLHEIGINGNISNQTTFRFGTFIYQINATDPDELTYNSDEFANLTYTSNDTRFDVHPKTGLINVSILNESFVGEWQINYSVSDGEFTDWKIMNLIVLPNNPPIINISQTNTSYLQNETILIKFQGIELDSENVSIQIQSQTNFNNSIYPITFINEIIDDINYINFTINMTKNSSFLANSQVGNHSIQLTLTDERGASNNASQAILNFTILNTNDAPFFTDLPNSIQPTQIVLGPVVAQRPFNKTIYAQDYDLLVPQGFANEVLTYTVSNQTDNIANLQINKLSGAENQARLSFFPVTTGNASFLIRVTDSEGLFEEQNVSFEIFGTTENPVITQIKPHTDNQNTLFNFTPISTRTNESVTLQVETTTEFLPDCSRAIVTNLPPTQDFIFDAIATFDNITLLDNNITYMWHIQNVSVLNITNAIPGVNSEFNYTLNINQSVQKTVKLIIVDERFSQTSFEWIVTLNTGNRPPVYCQGSMQDLEISGTTIIPNYFSYTTNPLLGNTQRFYDPDEDFNMNGIRRSSEQEFTSLSYGVLNPQNCGLIDFTFIQDQLTLFPKTTGICVVRFFATDTNQNTVLSDNITITVLDVVEQQTQSRSVSTPTPRPIPFQDEVDVPKPVRIVFPGNASIFTNQSITVPILLENTYTDNIRGVNLVADMPNNPDITYVFGQDFWQQINIGQIVQTTLTVTNFRVEEAPYELRVHVNVSNPSFSDTASILVAGIEQSGAGEDREIRVTFARDLLAENPECQELNDYLVQAEQILQEGDIEAARQLVNIIINACRTLVRGEELRLENPGLVRRAISFSDENSENIILWTAILTGLSIALYVTISIKEKLLKI